MSECIKLPQGIDADEQPNILPTPPQGINADPPLPPNLNYWLDNSNNRMVTNDNLEMEFGS